MRSASLSPKNGRRHGRRGVSTISVTFWTVGMLCTMLLWNNRNLYHSYSSLYPNDMYSSIANDPPAIPSNVAVMVMSHRANFKQRQVIRDTWASRYKQNVFFLLGKPCRELQRLYYNNTSAPVCNQEDEKDDSIKKRLYRERLAHGDLILLNVSDHSEAAKKLRDGLAELVHINRNRRRFQWFVKVNDGIVVRIGPLTTYLAQFERNHARGKLSVFDPSRNATVFGQIVEAGAPVWKSGPYADVYYNQTKYPPWPRGPSGWVVSRYIAQYVADHHHANANDLFLSQGDDTSLGIWMDEAPFAVQWISDARLFRSQGECQDPGALIIGHQLNVDQIRDCYEKQKKMTITPQYKPAEPPFVPLRKQDADTSMEDTKIPSNWIQPQPLSQTSNNNMAFLVMSARRNYERRQTIRETWGQSNVYFVVGTQCDIAPNQRQDMTCIAIPPNNTIDKEQLPSRNRRQLQENHDDPNVLLQEQKQHGDIIMVAVKESYRSLPHKLLGGTRWLLQTKSVQWIVKVDDDMVMRIPQLEAYVKPLNPWIPTVLGDIIWDAEVSRTGKWAELYYDKKKYPAWPRGAAGYVFSRPIGEYLSSHANDLFKYQGEDTSMGIWLNEAPFRARIEWIRTKKFSFDGNCLVDDYLVMGHDMEPERIRECHNHNIHNNV